MIKNKQTSLQAEIMDILLSHLIEALRCLPGIGPRSAQRMVFYLLQHQRDRGLHLASCLDAAMREIIQCERCNNHTTTPVCILCQNKERDGTQLCIVESPIDLMAIEQSNVYRGTYFILMGKISPLDGIGPNEINLHKLDKIVRQEPIKEVILALNPSIEGQTTIHFIHELLHPYHLQISQLAHGIPSGGELEFLDSHTISHALRNRSTIK